MTHLIPYISRQSAENLQKSFAAALVNPSTSPVMFYIWGIGGVGKSTLKRRLRDTYQDKADFTEVSFGLTQGIDTPLDLMAKLHAQLPPLSVWKKPLFEKDPFQELYDQYQQVANKLQTQSVEGKKSPDKEQIEQVKSLLKVGASALGSLFPLSDLSKPVLETAATTTVDIAGILLTEKDRWQQILQQHQATKKNKELQALMLEPIPKLTKAFVEALVQRSQQTKKTVVLVLDTYEKSASNHDSWLWQSLLANTELRPHRVRVVVAGRKNLLEEEVWRKIQQDLDLVFECQLDRFDLSQTQKYLQDIGITDESEIAAIFRITKGLPYYLNWIRQQQEKSKSISFVQGNQAIVKLLLQGLTDTEKQILQLAACCRMFDRRLIQHLLDRQTDLKWENPQNFYEWLTQREFVEPSQRFYRLDDVARDVFRESLWQESIEHFQQTHKIISDYLTSQADRTVDPEKHISEKYASTEWCRYKAEALYYDCFAANRDICQTLLKYFFESHYFKQNDVIATLFTAIDAEAKLEIHELLPESTRKFLSAIQPAVIHGWIVLEEDVVSTEELDKRDLSQSQLESTRQVCFSQIHSLRDLAKFAALICKAKIAPNSQRLQCLEQAKEIVENLVTDTNREFSSRLFFWGLGNSFFKLANYEEAIASYDRALQIKTDYYLVWYIRGASLTFLGRNEEAIASYDRALQIKTDYYPVWYSRGVVLGNLGRYEEAIDSYDRALQINPDKDEAWHMRGVVLGSLGRYEETIASFDRALQIKPDFHEAWNNRGNPLVNLGRNEEAIISYDEALQLNPELHEAWYNRGDVLSELGRHEEAIASYDRALQINPDDHEAWSSRGYAFLKLERFDDAFASFEKEMEFNEGSAYYDQACFYAVQDRVDESIINLQKAIQIDREEYLERAKTNSDFDNIRSDSRFQELIQ